MVSLMAVCQLDFCNLKKKKKKMCWVNSVDPDQTAPKEQSDLDVHCLPP